MPPVKLLLARQLRMVLMMVKKGARRARLVIDYFRGILRRHCFLRLRASLERDRVHLFSLLRLTLLHRYLSHAWRYRSLRCLTLVAVLRFLGRTEGYGLRLELDHARRLSLLLDLVRLLVFESPLEGRLKRVELARQDPTLSSLARERRLTCHTGCSLMTGVLSRRRAMLALLLDEFVFQLVQREDLAGELEQRLQVLALLRWLQTSLLGRRS